MLTGTQRKINLPYSIAFVYRLLTATFLEFFNNYFYLYVLTINRVSDILGKEDVSTLVKRVLTTSISK